jgi:DNA-directed RNA polymerase III subunit RPC5
MPGRVRVRVKQEEEDDDTHEKTVNLQDDNNDYPMTTEDDNDDNATTSNSDDDDEIVREMDVYLSPPSWVNQLYMLQFPLQQMPTSKQSKSQAPPTAARIKPNHNMIELDHAIPIPYIEQDGGKHLFQRTYGSHTVPVTTHLALGKVIKTTTTSTNNNAFALHLTPLNHITQLRPTFHHIDQDDDDNADNIKAWEEEQARASSTSRGSGGGDPQANNERRPLTFQRRESERAATARKNSYAHKKARQDGEDWIDLQVIDMNVDDDSDDDDNDGIPKIKGKNMPSKDELTALKHCLVCPDGLRYQSVVDSSAAKVGQDDNEDDAGAANTAKLAAAAAAAPSLVSYVRSLDYLPAVATTAINRSSFGTEIPFDNGPQNYVLDWKQAGLTESDFDLPTLGAHLTKLLGNGWPVPFSILQRTLPQNVPEKDILTSLASCAILVRGNYVLQSRLLRRLPKPVAKARTFLLLLLQCIGVIHRSRIDYVFGICALSKDTADVYDDDDASPFYHESLTSETILMLLDQVAKITPDGWVLRGQDDSNFLHRFPENTNLHVEYWGRQMVRFQEYLQRYAEAK